MYCVLFYILCKDESIDFVPVNTNLTFSPELLTVMCVDIVIIDDTVFDPNESFLVQLLPLDANVAVVQGPLSETEIVIVDNDGRNTHTHAHTHTP